MTFLSFSYSPKRQLVAEATSLCMSSPISLYHLQAQYEECEPRKKWDLKWIVKVFFVNFLHKMKFAKLKFAKFRDFGDSRKFLPAKVSAFKVFGGLIFGILRCNTVSTRKLQSTFKAETFAGRNFRESPKSRNFANLSFANFILWRKFTGKTFAIF